MHLQMFQQLLVKSLLEGAFSIFCLRFVRFFFTCCFVMFAAGSLVCGEERELRWAVRLLGGERESCPSDITYFGVCCGVAVVGSEKQAAAGKEMRLAVHVRVVCTISLD